MATSVLESTSRKKRWHRRRARHALRPMRPTRLRLHVVTWLATLAVVWSLWYQYNHVGFGQWIGPKIAPPSWRKAGSNGPGYRPSRDVFKGTFLVNGRHGEFWPTPISPNAAAAGMVARPYEDHPFVRTMLATAAGLLIVCTLFAVEQWARSRFRVTIMSLLILTTVSAIAFSVYLPYEGTLVMFAVRLPMFLAVGICPLAWLLTTRTVMRRMSAVA